MKALEVRGHANLLLALFFKRKVEAGGLATTSTVDGLCQRHQPKGRLS